MTISSLYNRIRPLLWKVGVLSLMRRIFTPERRANIAKRIGLVNYVPPLPPRLPYRGRIRPDGVNYIADLRADIGLGESARLIHQTLLATGIGMNTQEVVIPMIQRTATVEIPPNTTHYDITLAHLNSPELRLGLDKYPDSFFKSYTIAHWYWELPQFPELWLPNLKLLDEIWTSSRYTQNIFTQVTDIPVHYFPTPVIVTPEPVTRAQFGIPEGRFIFFFAFNPGSSVARKNPYALIEAYKRAFEGMSHPPLLVMKVHHLSQHPTITPQLVTALENVGGILITNHLTRSQMHGLINLSDCVVSLHRAEGFGLLMAEAMAMGKPVIATGYSSNMDFMTEDNSFPVRYRLCEITPDDHKDQPSLGEFYTAGQIWAAPDMDHAAELMRHIYNTPSSAQKRADRAKQDMARGWTQEAVGQKMLARLRAIAQEHT